MRFPRGIRGEFRAHCINFSQNDKREPPQSWAVRGERSEMENGGAAGRTNKHFAPSRPATPISKCSRYSSRRVVRKGSAGPTLNPEILDSCAPAHFDLSVCPSMSLDSRRLHSRARHLTFQPVIVSDSVLESFSRSGEVAALTFHRACSSTCTRFGSTLTISGERDALRWL